MHRFRGPVASAGPGGLFLSLRRRRRNVGHEQKNRAEGEEALDGGSFHRLMAVEVGETDAVFGGRGAGFDWPQRGVTSANRHTPLRHISFATKEKAVVFMAAILHQFPGQSIYRMSEISTPIYRLCRVLDHWRVRCLRLLGPPGHVLVRRRDLRVAVFGTTVIAAALAGSIFLPLWLLALGPVILGTPHVLSDVRYLVMRPGYHRRIRLWLPVGLPLVVAGCGFHPMEFGFAAVAAAAVLCAGGVKKKLIVLAATAVLATACVAVGDVSRIIFAHVHNLVALVLWWSWRPRNHWGAWLVPLFFVLAAAALSLGWLTPLTAAWSWIPGGIGLDSHAETLAPGLSIEWAGRLVVLFAFAQAVHYGIWLRLIPEDDRPRETPRTFNASFRALENDVGRAVLWSSAIVATGIAVWAVLDLAAARIGYLRMALFHGYLELTACALLFIEGRKSSPSPCPPPSISGPVPSA